MPDTHAQPNDRAARRGRHAGAEELARAAVAKAEVLLLSGKGGEARAALEQALQRYERKGNLVMARRTRDRLAAAALP